MSFQHDVHAASLSTSHPGDLCEGYRCTGCPTCQTQ